MDYSPSLHKSQRLVELDALRGIAAFVVVVFHFTREQVFTDYGFKFGVTGVDLFFIISGFVILLTLKKTKSWKDFVVNRFSRLFPVYWTCVTFTFIVKIISHLAVHKSVGLLIPQYFANMTMFQLYVGQPDLDGSYWTMIVEMLFYILMLFFFINKWIEYIDLICSLILIPIGIYAFIPSEIYPQIHLWVSIKIPLINHFPLFFAGILFYKIKFDGSNIQRYLLLIFCFIVQLYLFDDGGQSFRFLSYNEYFFSLLFYFCLFIFYVNDYITFIVNRVTIFLGAVSYALYLIHSFFGQLLIYQLIHKFHLTFWIAAFLIALPVVLLLAWLINRFVEKPAMKFMRNWFGTRYNDDKEHVVTHDL